MLYIQVKFYGSDWVWSLRAQTRNFYLIDCARIGLPDSIYVKNAFFVRYKCSKCTHSIQVNRVVSSGICDLTGILLLFNVFYPPWKRGDIGLSWSVCPSVCPSVPLDIGYFVHTSLVWRRWARGFKFHTRINQGLKSCLVKVLSRSVENFFFRCQVLCADEFGLKQLS